MTKTKPLSSRRSRGARPRYALPLALLAAVSLATCGGTDEDGDGDASTPDTTSSTPSPTPPTASGESDAGRSDGTPLRISLGDRELTARLADNATTRDLSAQLPLTLTFRDHNSVEKTAPLPRVLSTGDAPEGHDPAAGEIGYYAPGGDFVLYYDDDAPYFKGIVRIGEVEGDLEPIERLPDGASVTIEHAERGASEELARRGKLRTSWKGTDEFRADRQSWPTCASSSSRDRRPLAQQP